MIRACLFLASVLVSASALAQAPADKANPRVEIYTSEGNIVAELYADKAPKSVENFLAYVKSGQYNGTIFHRVIDGFMVQGGGYSADLQLKPTRDAIQNEADNGLKNSRYTLAMARTGDPHSATSQFFINVADNAFLDHKSPATGQTWGYAVFGKVVEGTEVVDKIKAIPTSARSPLFQNLPSKPVLIQKVEVLP
ncbi:MAG: peptidyl-prolyl cis-trans isomerase [Xanthomonadales bacterium]|nr:peptidyl-prolyl cis-trans isomerase [Xanthomonadales bacterium]MCB1629924.1 peptidyl-prolyl cis-trans isomerase [Xanthomonadales bacterium]MCB1634027.1 peptidyl-prolyl cis-trans isomerase [Xanthomonadales bacterium]